MARRRTEQDSDWTRRYQQDKHDSDEAASSHRFSKRSKFAHQVKMRQTAQKRLVKEEVASDIESLPIGEVIQVFSVFCEVLAAGVTYLATARRTMQRLASTAVVVGDQVRLRPSGHVHETGLPEAAIEQVLPRKTVLLRQDSFHKQRVDPIVANAEQMLIVTSILQPNVKWGLVDRMLIAAESGGLTPIVCLNKIDLAPPDSPQLAEADEVLAHYQSLGLSTLKTSADSNVGIDLLREELKEHRTVLAGHSGVGKSSLIRNIFPDLDIKVGAVSGFNDKGRHTTSSARRYPLPFGGEVIDTPGIRHFGLVDVTPDSLLAFFPDVEAETAPEWRVESYQRILASLQ